MTIKHAPRGPIKANPSTRSKLNTAKLPFARDRSGIDKSGYDPDLCHARSARTGNQCRRRPNNGCNVCRFHGGAAPQVQRAAMERLIDYQHTAISRLFGLAEQENYPSTAYQAVRDILDRSMGRPAETVSMNLNHTLDITSVLKQRLDRRRALTSGE
jgi:hypothetical protein